MGGSFHSSFAEWCDVELKSHVGEKNELMPSKESQIGRCGHPLNQCHGPLNHLRSGLKLFLRPWLFSAAPLMTCPAKRSFVRTLLSPFSSTASCQRHCIAMYEVFTPQLEDVHQIKLKIEPQHGDHQVALK